MITFILKLLVLIYLSYTINKVYDMLQYNPNATIITIDQPNIDRIELEIRNKCPLIIKSIPNHADLTIESMNYRIPGYIIKDGNTLISLDKLQKSDIISIYKNSRLVEDYQLTTYYSSLEGLFSSYFTCGSNSYLSLYRGTHTTPLLKNYRETLLIQPISGQVIIYLFNPKHERDIKGQESIKKWGIRLELNKDNLLYIPPEWYYFYESHEEVILAHIETDSYSTFLFNYLRKK